MSAPYYTDDAVTLYAGDCLEVLPTLPDNSVDAVVTDPPYGLEFMGKQWDSFKQSAGANSAGFNTKTYKDGSTAQVPNYTGGVNPTCRKCGGLKSLNTEGSGGRTKCRCEAPEFPNYLLPKMHAFQQWCQLWATECLRVLKPGAYLTEAGEDLGLFSEPA